MNRARLAGFTLLEVLITMLILVFGLLALANLQAKMNLTQMEAYQRAQAVVLMQDMLDRIANNRNEALTTTTYVTGTTGTDSPVGTAATPDPCSTLTTLAARDKCDWSSSLLGAAEVQGGNKIGAMIGARGCVERIDPQPNPAPGVCTPATYRVTVVWQGINPTVTPLLACGQNLYGGGGATNDAYRRAISQQLVIGLPACS